jgi:hypothetical protein
LARTCLHSACQTAGDHGSALAATLRARAAAGSCTRIGHRLGGGTFRGGLFADFASARDLERAWYGHLRDLAGRPWHVAALLAWSVAFFEYQFQVPANRIGYASLSLPQLKILQEVISLVVFVPFSLWYMRAPLGADYFWACLCILGAVFFLFRSAALPG